jgi:hypothetical protein
MPDSTPIPPEALLANTKAFVQAAAEASIRHLARRYPPGTMPTVYLGKRRTYPRGPAHVPSIEPAKVLKF